MTVPVVSVAVMTHPARLDRVRTLAERHPELSVEVVVDPDPSAARSTLRTSRRAWAAAPLGSTHHLVLQDDVVLRPDFAQALRSAVSSRPDDALVLFAHWSSRTAQAIRHATLTGASWARCIDAYVPTQAVVLPAAVGREFADVARRIPDEVPDNWALKLFLDRVGVPALATTPTLVDHDVEGSLMGNHVFLGPRRSVTPVGHEDVAAPLLLDATERHPVCLPVLDGLGAQTFLTFLDGDGGGGASAMSFLVEAGLGSAWIEERLEADLGGCGELARAGAGISGISQVWLAALLLGVVASSTCGAQRVRETLGSSAQARAAISTLPAGAMARAVRLADLEAVASPLAGLAIAGVVSGTVAVQGVPALADLRQHVDRAARYTSMLHEIIDGARAGRHAGAASGR